MPEPGSQYNRGVFWQALLLTALITGTLDALAAIISFILRGGHQPARIFRYIASGVFGRKAASGGPGMVVYGVLFHYFIAFCFTCAFFVAYSRLPFLRRSPWLVGLVYGIFIWVVMNGMIVPLSRTPPATFTWPGILIGIGVLVMAIGLPVCFLARAWLSRP